MIYRLSGILPSVDCQKEVAPNVWVRAMHLPFQGGLIDRLRDAWQIICGRAYAFRWPKDGEYEEWEFGQCCQSNRTHQP